MWWPERFRFALPFAPVVLGFVAAILSSCGFHPLYGSRQSSGLDEQLAAISVAPAPDRIGQMLVLSLRGAFNPSGLHVPPRYSLSLTVYHDVGDFAIRKDGTASRELYSASTTFQLHDIEHNAIVLGGSARTNDSYDVGENPYTTIVANQDADRKAAEAMSLQIQAQIAIWLKYRANVAKPAPS
jgi:LPS-assembly lipoprotein